MFSETVTYENWDGVEETTKLWFHLNKQDILDHPELENEVQLLRDMFQSLENGTRKELSELEVRSILAFVKKVAQLSYGIRSEDGKKFRKRGAWEEFEETAAYDSFLTGLFAPSPVKSFEFLLGVMPRDLLEQAEAEMKKNDPESAATLSAFRSDPSAVVAQGPVLEQLTPKPYSEMSREELEAALAEARK